MSDQQPGRRIFRLEKLKRSFEHNWGGVFFFPKDLVEGLLLKALGLTYLPLQLPESGSGFKHL